MPARGQTYKFEPEVISLRDQLAPIGRQNKICLPLAQMILRARICFTYCSAQCLWMSCGDLGVDCHFPL